jgi:acetate kinase
VPEEACRGLEFLGVGVDPRANAQAVGDVDLTATGAATQVLVIAAREDLEIARQVREVLGSAAV